MRGSIPADYEEEGQCFADQIRRGLRRLPKTAITLHWGESIPVAVFPEIVFRVMSFSGNALCPPEPTQRETEGAQSPGGEYANLRPEMRERLSFQHHRAKPVDERR